MDEIQEKIVTIQIPKIRIVRPQYHAMVAEEAIKNWVRVSFWISPFAVWKIIELIKPYFIN